MLTAAIILQIASRQVWKKGSLISRRSIASLLCVSRIGTNLKGAPVSTDAEIAVDSIGVVEAVSSGEADLAEVAASGEAEAPSIGVVEAVSSGEADLAEVAAESLEEEVVVAEPAAVAVAVAEGSSAAVMPITGGERAIIPVATNGRGTSDGNRKCTSKI